MEKIHCLLAQVIICGILLAGVLLLCVLRNDYTQNVRQYIKATLAYSLDGDRITSRVKDFLSGGGLLPQTDPADDPLDPSLTTNPSDSSIRIDESLLMELQPKKTSGGSSVYEELVIPLPDNGYWAEHND